MSRASRSFSRRLTKAACGCAALGLVYNHWIGLNWHTALPPPPPPMQGEDGATTGSSSSSRTHPSTWTRREMWDNVVALSSSSSSNNSTNQEQMYDVCVIGGGLTGLYTAVDAAQRGFKVIVVDANDFGSSNSSSLLGFLPGAFPACQRAWKQRDATFLGDAIDAIVDIRTWGNVAPGCIQRVKTLVPGSHTTESWELRIAAWSASLLSLLAGSWHFGHHVTQSELSSMGGVDDGTTHMRRSLSSGVMVEDAVLDVPRVVNGLSATARQLGAHTLNYVAAVDIAAEERLTIAEDSAVKGDEEHVAYRVTLENRAPPSSSSSSTTTTTSSTPPSNNVAIRARTIVNCSGSAIDTVRQYDTWLTSTLMSTAAAAAQGGTTKEGDTTTTTNVTAKTHLMQDAAPTQLIESSLTYEFFVVPRDGFVFTSGSGSGSDDSVTTTSTATKRPVFPSSPPSGEGGSSMSSAPLNAFISNSSLRNFSSVTVLPYGADGLLIGGAAPVRRTSPTLTHFRQHNHSKSLEQHDESEGHGALSLEQRRSIRRAVEKLAAPLGMAITDVASCRPVLYPLLAKPTTIGNELATQIEYRGFGALVGGAGGRGSMVHLLGGTAAGCRRAAKEATDVVAMFLEGSAVSQTAGGSLIAPPAGKKPGGQKQSKTEFLQIVKPNTDVDTAQLSSHPGDTIQRMVREGYAQTVEDVIARRTQAAWMDPARTRLATPMIASLMAKELGWSATTTQRMIKEANTFLDRIVV
ncbi:glycerol-3-phosphate dehydrogenase, putative [Bodo saltans]|uniref:Glycerol-3-phosphate dehydrogenase, putative n=2 Tax=Bodo saltans TaxID=75058 RepID=A0A0S4J696_BODSA|nr:glycerol-3-phosphate dehydrogenase, putative [Bodo saltans]|eukprot:CUG65671.1 glycerol-3-phosphate dehydrogenase, putative [Bodo saltans]